MTNGVEDEYQQQMYQQQQMFEQQQEQMFEQQQMYEQQEDLYEQQQMVIRQQEQMQRGYQQEQQVLIVITCTAVQGILATFWACIFPFCNSVKFEG